MAVEMVVAIGSRLLDLDQRAGKVLWMQEQHRLAVGSDLRLTVPEHPRALPDQAVAGRDNIRHVIADMMDAAVGVAVEEFCDRRGLAKRLDELDLGVGQRDKHGENAMLGQ